MQIMYPDYNKSVLSVTNSIISHYGIPPYHKTLQCIDDKLKKKYKNVVVMIFDGLGSTIMEKHLNKNSFLYAHKRDDISSVFPPTTTAATISMQTGHTPIEHGWLGWTLYFHEIDKNVNIFTNIIAGTKDKQAADFNVALKYLPYENIFTQIMAADSAVNAECIAPFMPHPVKSVREICETVQNICMNDRRNFLLTYWNEPDGAMHKFGTESKEAHDIILDIDGKIVELSEQLTDSLIIVTADHGLIDVDFKFIVDYPSILECLVRPQSIESRAANFFVKEDKKIQFEEEFKKYFGSDYLLFTREQVLERKLFGDGIPHKKALECLGDFLAISTGKISIDHERPAYRDVHKAQHAGLTAEEMTVPLIIIDS